MCINILKYIYCKHIYIYIMYNVDILFICCIYIYILCINVVYLYIKKKYMYSTRQNYGEKTKRFNLQAPPVYDRKVTNLFFSIIIVSIIVFFP